MRYILGAIMAAAIAGAAFVQPAEARCFPDGFGGVTCVRHGPMYGGGTYGDWGYRHHAYRGFDRGFDRPYWWGGY
jgi:hypothetical protein